jgi:hypothetical protein
MVKSTVRDTSMRVAAETGIGATSAPTTPSVDVQALTSQVIQQLDRRLIAYRERMGRS